MGLHRRPLYCVNEDEFARRAPMGALQHYVRARLHRRLFMWFGASIVMTGATVVIVLSLFFPAERDPREQYLRFQTFVGHRFADVWDEPERRAALATAVADELDVGVRLEDPAGVPMGEFGAFRDDGAARVAVHAGRAHVDHRGRAGRRCGERRLCQRQQDLCQHLLRRLVDLDRRRQ